MNSVFRKLLQTSVVACFTLGLASAYDLSKKTSVSIFKGFGKYPCQFKLNPFRNQIDVILYGCLDASENVKLVKSAEDYANLVPVQFTINSVDSGTKVKKTYHGYYETCTTKIADSTLRIFGLLPGEDYKKDFKSDFLMAECKAGMPIKMVFENLDQFKAIKNYLSDKLGRGEVTEEASAEETMALTPAKKPLLLIEIESGQELEQDDVAFLDAHFELADAKDADVQAFFDKAEKKIGSVKDLAQVGKSFGDGIMEIVDKTFDNGDAKKLALAAISFFVVALTIDWVKDLARNHIINPIKTGIVNATQSAVHSIKRSAERANAAAAA